jgi:hypothetical protein
MLAALDAADTTMRTFRTDPSEPNAAAARSAIGQLSEVLQDHLAHEERDLEPVAAAQLGTPQMKAASRKVRAAYKGNAGTFMAWLLDGADADAKAGLRHEIPAPVLFMLSRVGGRAYNRRIAPVWA